MKKLILKTALITFACILAVLLVLVTAMTMLAPRTMSEFFDGLGGERASLWYMELSWRKFGDTDDLTELFAKSADAEDYERVEKYGRELSGREDFARICVSQDAGGAEIAFYDYVCGNTAEAIFKNGDAAGAVEFAAAHTDDGYPPYNALQTLLYADGAKNDGALLASLKTALEKLSETGGAELQADLGYLNGLLK